MVVNLAAVVLICKKKYSLLVGDLICFGGDCHVVVCLVEVTGKDNTQVLVFRELLDRFSINCIGCSIYQNQR